MQLPGKAQSPTLSARYIWGAAIVWVAIWIGTAVVLKGGGTFADMIPILTVGTGWFMAVVPGQLAASDHSRSGHSSSGHT
jgi:hypothetical protein